MHKYYYTAEYEPQLNFISNDYHEMEIISSQNFWFTGKVINKLTDDTISVMDKVFKHILRSSEHFHVFFSFLYANADLSNGKDFFEAMLRNKIAYKCSVINAQDIFIKLLDFSDPLGGRRFLRPKMKAIILIMKCIIHANYLMPPWVCPVHMGK